MQPSNAPATTGTTTTMGRSSGSLSTVDGSDATAARAGSPDSRTQHASGAPTAVDDPQLEIVDVTVRYDGAVALDGINLQVAAGEHVAIVGPSGCGKSTLVRAIAGLVAIDDGSVAIAGSPVAGDGVWVPPERRGVGVVFQDHALFGHLSVRDNVAFGLRGRGDVAGRVAEVLALVGLAGKIDRHPHQLSGGEQQRVALARALAPRPEVLLLDEPFSNLDRNLRERIRHETAELLRKEAVTALFVTHDRDEALALGDRVAVVRAGRIEQIATPEEIYHAPVTKFVATFLDEAVFLRGQCATADSPTVSTALGDVPVAAPGVVGELDVMVRAHEVAIQQAPETNATVVATHFRGGEVAHVVDVDDDGPRLIGLRPHTQVLGPGDRVAVRIVADHPLAHFSVDAGDAHVGT